MKHILVLPSMRQLFLLFSLCTLSFTAEGQGNLSLVGPVHYNSNITFPISLRIHQFDTIIIPQNHVLKVENNLLGTYELSVLGSKATSDPLKFHDHPLSIELVRLGDNIGTLLYSTSGSTRETSFPLWIGSGTYLLRIHRRYNSSYLEFYRNSLHGLLFAQLPQ